MSFTDGNIVRILMKDFLTFDDMEVHPKPHLNVIIGPNGTGKSTIMCGLALAFCNKPIITGRGKEVSEYVKHGKDSAVVEVEIYRGNSRRKNLVVRRCFNRNNSSQFYLQGEKSSYKEVENKLKELNIQLDNLCQFLPQDRVVEFAKMNNVQLLENTEKTVGGKHLFEQHELLRNCGSEVHKLRTRLQQIQQQYQTELDKNNSVEEEVQNHEVRKRLEVEIKDMMTRRLWFLYNQQRKEHLQLKKSKEELVMELNRIKERWQPEEDLIEKFKQEKDKAKNKIRIEEHVVTNLLAESSALEQRWTEQEELRQDAVREFQTRQEQHQQQQISLQGLERQLEAIQAEIEEYNDKQMQPDMDDAALQQRIRELTGEVQSVYSSLTTVQTSLHETRNKHSNLLRTAQTLSNRLDRIQDTATRRMQLLKQRYADAYNAAMWLQQNSGRFRATVFSPICTQLNILNPTYAQYVEDRIPKSDLIAFVCRDKDDVNLLKQIMDENSWAVNIVHSDGELMTGSFKPTQPSHVIKQLGFDMYLLDAIEGPPAILHYLCKNYALHNIPVAVAETVNRQSVPSDFIRYYIGDSRYHINRSRYTQEVMTGVSGVQKPILLSVVVNTKELLELRNEHQRVRDEITQCESIITKFQEKEREAIHVIEEKRRIKQQLQQQRSHRKTLIQRFTTKQEQISRLVKDRVDLDKAAREKELKIQGATRGAVDVLKNCVEIYKRQSDVKHTLTALRSQFKCLYETVTELEGAIQEMHELYIRKKQEVTEAAARVKETVRLGQETLQELLNSLGLSSPSQIDEGVRASFMAGIQGLEATEQKLTELEAHRDCLVTADAQVVEEYNRRKKAIENLSVQLAALREEETRCSGNMAEQRKEWLSNIASLTTTINNSFSRLMSRMKCAGEVKLSKPDNEDDLAKYGLSICVRFRGSEKLRELTAQQQSGGERAVSTALYLLSLQTLSRVPFRCADEINQGMDAENERQMFTMLVEHMTDANASQYFLVTPKLLPNLPYNDRVNFICVFNGPKILTQINMKEALKRKNRLNKSSR